MISYKYKSPNYNNRVKNSKIEFIIIHYTGVDMQFHKVINWFLDERSRVSCHFLIDKSGEIYNLVDVSKRAWHAGKSFWNNCVDINSNSIGIELHNAGNEDFTSHQLKSLVKLIKKLMQDNAIQSWNILGHSDVSIGRKIDPGIKFPWHHLAKEKIGFFSNLSQENFDMDNSDNNSPQTIKEIQSKLMRIGYDVNKSGVFDMQTVEGLKAFQRHWRPVKVSGMLDVSTKQILTEVHKKLSEYRAAN
ncbi:MAG: N-acetylmuramoyl-L-alanine amidase [Rhodobiaceae bacterium]|nr:N-acetylmuramoyl-L-alanine amidase [Rhodobiaceae bacterium]